MKGSFQTGIGAALTGVAASFAVMGAPVAAFAANTAPHVDMTQPHDQVYPVSAQSSGEQGTVLVQVYVSPSGKVAKYNVAQSSGFGDLDNAALESVLNWRFVPAMRDGDPVSDWTVVKVVYQLPQAATQPASPPG
ncbi:MAG TPA: energy transducer TonB [Rhizomicrobium sp.]|nr:energy transducer TonB [Rhizomicrobium sp.]